MNLVYASAEAREYAIEKAEQLQSTLEPHYPTLVKSMLPSHVSGGFWLVTKFNAFATLILFDFDSLHSICPIYGVLEFRRDFATSRWPTTWFSLFSCHFICRAFLSTFARRAFLRMMVSSRWSTKMVKNSLRYIWRGRQDSVEDGKGSLWLMS